MTQEDLFKAYGISTIGHNELTLTNSQVKSLYFLLRRDVAYRKNRLDEALEQPVPEMTAPDNRSVIWAYNNSAHLFSMIVNLLLLTEPNNPVYLSDLSMYKLHHF